MGKHAVTICFGNYKGGVGKTKNAVLNAYEIAKKGKRCLVVDLDPQGNATTVLVRTKQQHTNEVFVFNKTLMGAVKDNDLTGLPVNIVKNLDLLPSYIDFAGYISFLDLTYGLVPDNHPAYKDIQKKKLYHLKHLLEPFSSQYDYVFIDVPPTKSVITDSAVIASQYVLIVLQTQELALDGALAYLQDLNALYNDYDAQFDICGVLPVLMDGRGSTDLFILERAKQEFGEENIFKTHVPNMARLKRFDNTGILEEDRWDIKVIDLYKKVSKELMERIAYFEEAKRNNG